MRIDNEEWRAFRDGPLSIWYSDVGDADAISGGLPGWMAGGEQSFANSYSSTYASYSGNNGPPPPPPA